jgi:hypothetical protein
VQSSEGTPRQNAIRVLPPIPKTGITQNKSRIRGVFFEPRKRPSEHHVYHAFHHDLTIKKPRSSHLFSQNPSKNNQVSLKEKLPKYALG